MTSAKVRTTKKFSAWCVPATLAAIKTLVRQGGVSCTARFSSVVAILLCGALASSTVFADPLGFLETVHRHTTLMNTVPDNGDQNPYAIAIAPVSAGAIKKGDVLVDNFNNAANLQGTGSTIVDYHPDTKQMTLFAFVPRALKDCPGGIGLSTAMTILKSGWVVVGSTPSNDGTTDTKGAGCLVVLDTQGKVVSTITSPNINDPWGNMAVIDNGSAATLFVSNAGFGVGSAKGEPPVFKQATVLRLDLDIPEGKPPVVKRETVIGSGFGAQADQGVFLIGPTGLALSADGKLLYVSDAIGNRITAIDDPVTRDTSAGVGRKLTADGFLHRPLAMTTAPNGHLLVTNALNGQLVEIDPASGKQIYARSIDTDRAQTPPGNGDLFGIVMTPGGDGFYYVEDDVNTLPGLFSWEGKDRYGLANRRPSALVDLPRFNGDQLIADKTGGDLLVQACANDAQVAFHAVRQLARIGHGATRIRYGQPGFLSGPRGETPRNLMGFKDGSNNLAIKNPRLMNEFVWVGSDGPAWMQGGTYTVVRRIRITLEHWDRVERGFQESVVGREKYTGAPLGKKNEFDAPDLNAADKDGNPVIPENAHVRLSNRATNNGARILRRSYSYNDGTNFYIERWPPWRQETEYDSGLIFIAHQRDPRTGFIPINEKLAKFDMMNQFTTHVGSAIFACPPGVPGGSFIGAALFDV
jgi:Dyp-type peroxidase family